MKKQFVSFIALVVAMISVGTTDTTLAVSSTEEPISLNDGLHIGKAATDRIALWDGTPAAQSAATVSPFGALLSLGAYPAGTADLYLQHKTVSITAANIIAMYTTPVALIAAQGAGKSIVVQKVAFTITRSATAFTGGGAAIVQYAATANGAGTQALDSTLASTVITGAAGTTVSFRNGAVVSDAASTVTQNVGLYLSNATAVFADGTGTATVDIWYYVY